MNPALPDLHDTESDDLLRRCQRGDESALSLLVQRFQDRIYRLAFRISGDAALAEEATAQALVKIWTKSGQWSGQAGAATWIYRLAVYTALDVKRSQTRWWRRWTSSEPAVLSMYSKETENPAEQADEHRVNAERLQQALDGMSESDRVLVHLYYYENKGLAEIEPILGVPKETLKMRLARARQKLKLELENE